MTKINMESMLNNNISKLYNEMLLARASKDIEWLRTLPQLEQQKYDYRRRG